jgi:hypothetical protein
MAERSEVISFDEKLREKNIQSLEARLDVSSKSLKDLMRAHVMARNNGVGATPLSSGPK